MSNRRLLIKEKPAQERVAPYTLHALATKSAPTPPRWTCTHHIDGSDITAFVAPKNGLEVIAQTHRLEGVDAQANAELIVNAVNSYEISRPLTVELLSALELCLQCGSLSWEAEQEADIVCAKAKKLVGSLG